MSKTISDVCANYVKATAKIYFTGDNVWCNNCPLLETYSRRQCRLTGEYLIDGYYRGRNCPLEIVEEIKVNPETGEIEE